MAGDDTETELNASYGETVQFGNAADDYTTYRASYPAELFRRLAAFGVGTPEQRLLDVGTGTGFLANEFADRGCAVVGLDVDRALLAEARVAGESVGYVRGETESLPFPADTFDAVTAGQCWHWFDRERAAAEARRVLHPGGTVALTHFDWLPRAGNAIAATETLILEWSPDWPGGGGTGFYPKWADDLAAAGFEGIESFSFETTVEYSHEAWRGRIRASAGVGGSLPPEEVRAFDDRLAELLAKEFPEEPLELPHRSFTIVGRNPEA